MTCLRTSYNTYDDVYLDADTGEPAEDQSKKFRGNFACINAIYIADGDYFTPAQEYQNWVYDSTIGNLEIGLLLLRNQKLKKGNLYCGMMREMAHGIHTSGTLPLKYTKKGVEKNPIKAKIVLMKKIIFKALEKKYESLDKMPIPSKKLPIGIKILIFMEIQKRLMRLKLVII